MKVLLAFFTILAVATARVVVTPSTWTLQELEAAFYDPTTPAALKPYLIEAFNNLMQQLFDGGVHTSIPVITPAGVLPSPSEVAAIAEGPTPAGVVAPIVPAEVVEPVAAEPAAPLVQIIINVKAEQQQAISPNPVVVSPVPEVVAPTPVTIVEQPEIIEAPTPVEVIDVPTPVNPIDVIAITPPEINPIDVIAITPPEINPIDVIAISPPEINPIDVIAITPPEINPIDVIAISPPEINPIDVIAIAAPEVNPIDVMAPLPAVSGGNDGGILV